MSFRLRSPGKIQLSENDVRKAVLDVLRVHHYWPIRQHVGKFRTADDRWVQMGVVGDPDYAVIKPPSFFLELKRPGGKVTDEQFVRINQLKQFYGLQTAVVESVEELIDWLDRRERSP